MSAQVLTNGRSPYPGLRPFQPDEADLFFGRGEQIEQMLAKLEDHRFLAVVGASGTGKSSLVRAGLLPALEEGYLSQAAGPWRYFAMRPGDAPFHQLAHAIHHGWLDHQAHHDPYAVPLTEATLRSGPMGFLDALQDAGIASGTNILLLVDQFEEIFRFRYRELFGADDENGAPDGPSLHDERNEAISFVSLLLAATRHPDMPVYVVITMRSDFLGDCDVFRGLPEAISDSQFLTPRLSRRQLHDAICRPLELYGATAEPALVNRMLNQTGTRPDQLPLMQHALLRTWIRARDRGTGNGVTLQLADYAAIGELKGALSQHADEAYAELGDERKRRVAEIMFRCLSERSPEGRLMRRLAKVSEVAAVADVDVPLAIEVAEVFLRPGRSFLTTTPPGPLGPDTTLDISHEALIRQWNTLAGWLDKETESANEYRRLLDTARRWEQKRADYLHSPELESALKWRNLQNPNAAWAQRYGGHLELTLRFLDASVKEKQRERSKAGFRIFLVIVAVVSVLVAVITYRERVKADNARRESEAAEDDATLRAYNAQLARVDQMWQVDSQNALKLLENEDRCPKGLREFSWRFYHRLALTAPLSLAEHTGPVYSVAASPHGQRLASAGHDRNIILWKCQPRSGGFDHNAFDLVMERQWTASDAGPLYCLAFSPDGQTVASGSQGGEIRLWRVSVGEPQPPAIEGHAGYAVRSLAFSPDGGTLASASDDSTVRLWDTATGRLRTILKGHTNWVSCVRYAPEGKKLASASYDTTIKLWDTATGNELSTLRGHHRAVLTVAFSPDGKTLASAGEDRTTRLWDLQTASPRGRLTGHTDSVNAIAFSPDGAMIASVGEDKTVRLWELASSTERKTLKRHEWAIYDVAFCCQGKMLVSAGGNGTMKLWDATEGLPMGTDSLTFEDVTCVAFEPAKKMAALATRDQKIELWDLNDRKRRTALQVRSGAVNYMTLDQSGTALAAASEDGTIRLWSTDTGELVHELTGHDGLVTCLDFDATGKMLASGSDDTTVRVWDVVSGKLLHTRSRHTAAVTSVDFNRDGNVLASAGRDSTVTLWNPKTGDELKTWRPHDNYVWCVHFFDRAQSADESDSRSERLATAGDDRSVHSIKFWDMDTLLKSDNPEPLAELLGHTERIMAIDVTKDGQTMATAGLDAGIRLWDPELGDYRGTLSGHSSGVRSLCFQHDGTMLASADDHTIRIWLAEDPEDSAIAGEGSSDPSND